MSAHDHVHDHEHDHDRIGDDRGDQADEDRLMAAYEEQLRRMTVADMTIQAAVSLLNLGGRRLGLDGADGRSNETERDLEEVSDAIDGVRGLMVVLERRISPRELGPLKDALSQLQLAYARQAPTAQVRSSSTGETPPAPDPAGEATSRSTTTKPADPARGDPSKPGPAVSSGRLWIPGR